MGKNIIEYEGTLPPGVLEKEISNEDFYTPKNIQKLILKSFPQKDGNPLDGIEYIHLEDNSFCSKEERYKENIKQCATREELVAKLIPSFEVIGQDIEVKILESQIYKSKDSEKRWCPFERHAITLLLTDCGYLLDSDSLVSSNMP